MIPINTRILLIGSALIAFFYIVFEIRKSNLTIRDSIFWVLFSIFLVLMAIFPDLFMAISKAAGITSPANFIYLVIIGIMIVRIYRMSVTISTLNTKIKELTQSLAIQEYEINSTLKNRKKQ